MRTLYLDLFSGISGDMFLAAMIDLGVAQDALLCELNKLGVGGWHAHVGREKRGGIAGARFDVHLEHEHAHGSSDGHDHSHHHRHPHHHEHEAHDHHQHGAEHAHSHGRNFADIRGMIQTSTLSDWVKGKAIAVFHRVAAAEGKVHGQPPEEVHFHEVGAVDSIVDIVGACIALEMLGRPRVLASPVVEGTGFVHCAHGRLPLPAPATLEILVARGVTIVQCDEPHELVTPTGAALLAEFSESFDAMPSLTPERIGYGLGQRENKTRPNVLRAVLGESAVAAGHDWERDTVAVLETNLDDISSEILGSLVERALAAGALDVFHTPIQMKKSRPGVMLSLLCQPDDVDRFAEILLCETSAFGVRCATMERRKLRREIVQVKTAYGSVAVKIGSLNGRRVQAAPEFESCRQLADQAGVPLKQVYAAALRSPELM
jgi:pyridinium-3,5-bisthiocarboxylic acid mononucleotide nickel chelatase